jgi:hypothetical protein
LIRAFAVAAFLVAIPATSFAEQQVPLAPPSAMPVANAGSSLAASPADTPSAAPAALPSATPEPARRPGMPPAPLDPLFPSSDWEGPIVGTNVDPTGYPLETWLAKSTGFGKWLDTNRIRVYGWLNSGIEETNTTKLDPEPISYNPVANRIELDQAIMRIERDPDTVQQDRSDWGFRIDALYGVDYRWTTAYGYFSKSLQDYNRLNAFDDAETYAMLYEPHVFKGGTIFEFGRVISIPDIEAQLAPQNYLYTHSLMFDWDSYTQTGVFAWSKLSELFTIDYGILFGDDVAPWNPTAAFPSGQFFLKYTPKSNRDAVIVGVDAYNNRGFSYYLEKPVTPVEAKVCASYDGPGSTVQYTSGSASDNIITGVPAGYCLAGHDNLQQQNLTYYHKFSDRLHNGVEVYYLWTRNAPSGGSISNGPPQYAAGGGPGSFIPGRSIAVGYVDYLEDKITPNDFVSFRTDYMNDPQGWRTGYKTSYGSLTLGVTHHFSTTTWIRPELRIEKAFSSAYDPVSKNYVGYGPYDNLEGASNFLGTKDYQRTFGLDLIQWF